MLSRFQSCEEICKGWSGDKKYKVTDGEGNTFLLRVARSEKLSRFKAAFEVMKTLDALGVPLCTAYECGLCDEGAYLLQKFICGDDAEPAVMAMTKKKQYAYGLDSGRILKLIHTLPTPESAEPWDARFNAKIDRKLAMYAACPLKYEVDQPIIDYIAANRHLLRNRPQTYQHGDYHIGNMMIDRDGRLVIIDFDREDYGDPWEEFNRIVWCAQAAPAFASGMVDGYFDGDIPMEFWQLLALYICSNTLSSLPWAIPFGEDEIDTMRRQEREVLAWYDSMKTCIPSWYQPI